MPVRQLSSIEHDRLAGESACPTYSASLGGKSQKNEKNACLVNRAKGRLNSVTSTQSSSIETTPYPATNRRPLLVNSP
jgi:hypothetical protein